jgi:hypothetical protein
VALTLNKFTCVGPTGSPKTRTRSRRGARHVPRHRSRSHLRKIGGPAVFADFSSLAWFGSAPAISALIFAILAATVEALV